MDFLEKFGIITHRRKCNTARAKMFRTVTKVTLIASNAIGAVIGGTLILTGGIVLVMFAIYVAWLNLTFVTEVMRSLIILGALVMAVAAVGSLGSVYEGKGGTVLLFLYTASVLIILVLQIYVTVVLCQYRNSRNMTTMRYSSEMRDTDKALYKAKVTLPTTLTDSFASERNKYTTGTKVRKRNIFSNGDDPVGRIYNTFSRVVSPASELYLDKEIMFEDFIDKTGARLRETSQKAKEKAGVIGETIAKNIVRTAETTLPNELTNPYELAPTNPAAVPVPDGSSPPGLPSFFNLPSLPDLLSVPNLPTLPNLPSLPDLPSFPDLPSLPELPSLPTLPNLPNIKDLPNTIFNTWILPQILETDDNPFVKKLKPILGPLSKPALYVSMQPKIIIVIFAVDVWEGLCLLMAVYLTATKTDDDEDEEY